MVVFSNVLNLVCLIFFWAACACAKPGPSGWPEVVAEYYTPVDPPLVTYVHGSHGLISQRRGAVNGVGGVVRYYHGDGQGNIRLLTSAGAVTGTYDYDAYGNLTASTGTTLNNYHYTGQQWDPYLQMFYLRARYYNPTYGRFWSEDSYEGNSSDPASLHRYLYCGSDPANRMDSSGHMTIQMSLGVLGSYGGRTEYEGARASSYASGLAKAKALTQLAGFLTAGYLAEEYAIERTSVREYLEKAREI